MLTPTHLTFGVTSSLIAGGDQHLEVGIALICSMIPDLDTRQSLAGKALPFLSTPIAYHFGHRTLTHSLLFQVTIGAIALATLPKDYAIAILCGLVSHAFADMLTQSGVCWFWPSRARCVLPGSSKYRFETGSWAELAFACAMTALSFLLVWMNNSSAGTAGVIRSVIGDIAAARKQYDEQKGSHEFALRLKGRDNQSLEAIEGEYPVIASWAANGFLVQGEGGVWSVCVGEACKVYPEYAVLVTGKDIQTSTLTIQENRLNTKALQQALQPYTAFGNVFLSGKYSGEANPDEITVNEQGGVVRLYYALTSKLPESGWLKDVDLRVQVRHKPGQPPPELPLFEREQTRERIDPLLQKWL